MRTIVIEPNFNSWREAARGLLAHRVAPEDILWTDDDREAALFGSEETIAAIAIDTPPKVTPAFLDIGRSASAHTDARRWALLYRLVWRLTHGGERHLLQISIDPDVRQLQQWCKAVGRDIHKMHAFVRFRRVGTDETTGREQFVAWFEPEHRIVRLGSPFFRKRFASMDWSILTPYECAHWDGKLLHYTPGVPRNATPDEDTLDDLWRTYYRSIFNPARLKVNAMQSQMPKKYWKNLPEARLIEGLISHSHERVQAMLETEERPVKPAPKNAYLESLRRISDEGINSRIPQASCEPPPKLPDSPPI